MSRSTMALAVVWVSCIVMTVAFWVLWPGGGVPHTYLMLEYTLVVWTGGVVFVPLFQAWRRR